MDCSTPGFPVLHYISEFVQTHVFSESVMLSNHLILWHPLLLLPSIFPSIWVFPSESALHIRRPKYWSFSFSISPSNEYSGLTSFRIDWFDLLAVQGSQNLPQHHSSKAPILWCSAFFRAQLSHPYMTAGKTIAFTIQTFVGKVMSLLFNTLSRFVIAFLPRSNCLLISRLQTPSAGFPYGSAGKESFCNVGDWVQSLGWEDPLEKGKATHSSILAWRFPWNVWSMGSQKVRHD